LIIVDRPKENVAVCCNSEEEWKQVWQILVDSGYEKAPRLSANRYRKGNHDHIRISTKIAGDDCGFCDENYYRGSHHIISFTDFIDRYVQHKYAIHTPTLAKKVMMQQLLFSMGWMWITKDTTISRNIDYPFLFLNVISKTFSHGTNSPKYTILAVEEFMSDPEKYISCPKYVISNT
jgi:hypothetical protein